MEVEGAMQASLGTPLYPVSPERANRQSHRHSPSLPSDLPTRIRNSSIMSPGSRNSEVYEKVLAFNNLSNGSPQKRKDNDAALRRAMVGREEAEGETRRLKEENHALRRDLEESQARERKVAHRVETLLEEMHRLKETNAHTQSIYEKEIRRARKEAFKSSSNLVNLQEELKTTRNRFTLMREEVEVQKRKTELREKDAFSAQYKLVEMQEQLDNVTQQMKLVEEERDALRMSLKEEEVSRIAAEGRIPLPPSGPGDEFASPKKVLPETQLLKDMPLSDPFGPDEEDEVTYLREMLALNEKAREKALKTIDFMQLECQLNACQCRIAEKEGRPYIFDERLEEIKRKLRRRDKAESTPKPERHRTPTPAENSVIHHPQDPEPLIEFSPSTGTFKVIESPVREPIGPMAAPMRRQQASEDTPSLLLQSPPTASTTLAPPLLPLMLSESPSLLSLGSNEGRASDECQILPAGPSTSLSHSPPLHMTSSRKENYTAPLPLRALASVPAFRTRPATSASNREPHPPPPPPVSDKQPTTTSSSHTTIISYTTTIPLADPAASPERSSANKFPYSPGASKTREEALQSIEKWRRGRARSVTANAATPKRRVPGGDGNGKRDVSAPAGH